MANISNAHGTLTLMGDWTQEALDAFIPVLDCWSFDGEYGIQDHGLLTLEHPKTYFYGCGRWSFADTLECFDEWTRDWTAEHSDDNSHPLTIQQYEHLLALMKEQKLAVRVEFIDTEEGAGFEINEVYSFVSNGRFNFISSFETSLYPDCVCEDGAGLTSVIIPDGTKTIRRESFYGRPNLNSVTIPEGVEEIGKSAFALCKSLTDVTLPKSVSKIADFAFHLAGLERVTIPENVEKIEYAAFANCKNLTSVTFLGSATKIERTAFEGVRPAAFVPHIPISNFLPSARPEAVCSFAKLYLEDVELDEEIRDGYLKYIKRNKKKLYPIAIEHDELLRLMLAKKLMTEDDVQTQRDEAAKRNDAIKAAVQDYLNTL